MSTSGGVPISYPPRANVSVTKPAVVSTLPLSGEDVVNSCYDLLRRTRHLGMVELTDEADDEDGTGFAPQRVDTHELPQAFVEDLSLNAQIELGIGHLSIEQRTLLVLRDIHGCSYEEISEITGLGIGTVKSHICRARARLQGFLSGQPD